MSVTPTGSPCTGVEVTSQLGNFCYNLGSTASALGATTITNHTDKGVRLNGGPLSDTILDAKAALDVEIHESSTFLISDLG